MAKPRGDAKPHYRMEVFGWKHEHNVEAALA
jgi:hypothetical protein